jgi:hypothetical protein
VSWQAGACLVATPLLLAAALLAVVGSLRGRARCRVCAGPLGWRDRPAQTCAPCLSRWRLAQTYGNRAAWQRAVESAARRGLRGRAFREAVDTMLLADSRESRRAA